MKEVQIQGKGYNKQEESIWIGRGRSSSVVAIHLGNVSRRNAASETIDRYTVDGG